MTNTPIDRDFYLSFADRLERKNQAAACDAIRDLINALDEAEADKQLAVTAALIEAAEQAASVRWADDTCGKTAAMAEKAILALIDRDAGAALGRALAAERERCAKIAFTMVCEFGEPAFAGIVGDAIRAQGED